MQTHELLKKYFEKKKKSSPGFSLRSVAKRLDLSPSFLSRVISGQKPVPHALLVKLCTALDIDAEVLSTVKEAHLVSVQSAKVPRKGKTKVGEWMADWRLTKPEDLNILRQWFYLPILEFTTLADYDGKPESIANRLGLSVTTVEVAIRELIAHEMLSQDVSGKFVKTEKMLRWTSGKSRSEIRNFHDQMLERAQLELRTATIEEEFERRLICGITVTASPEKISAAKKKLSECLYEIANDLAESPGTEVYHLSGQLFPLTKNR